MKIKTRRYYFYYLLRVGTFFLSVLPVRMMYPLGRFLGSIAFSLLEKHRNQTIENLRMAFPLKSDKELRKIARGVFSNVVANFAELVHIPKLNKNNIDLWVKRHGTERIDAALLRGKGIIGMSAHFGNWEFMGPSMGIAGYEGVIIAKKINFYKYDEYIKKIRFSNGTETIDREESPKKILKVLRQNKILGMLADQDIDNIEGVFVDFFGKPAYTPTAPVKLAMISHAPIIPCYMVRNGRRYDCFIEEPIYVEVKPGDDKEKAVKYYTQKWTSILEKYIRKYPDQWV